MKRVNFSRIEIENFLSVGNEMVAIDFKSGLNVITGINHDKEDSKNGVGKTTIADAVFFSLFGTTIRELKKEEIVNNINEKKCFVTLYFDVVDNDDTKTYKLSRGISPNKIHLDEDGSDATKSTIPKTNEEICRIVGATPEVFKNAVIMTVNGTIPFMAQKKVEKRKFCEGLFDLGVFQDMLLEGRKRYNEVKGNIAIEEGKLEEVQNTLNIYTEQKNRKDTYRKERIHKLLGRSSNNTTELKDLNTTFKPIPTQSVDEFAANIKILETRRGELQDDISRQIRNIATKEEKINSKKRDITLLNTFGDMCDKCKRTFTDDDKKSTKEKILLIEGEIDTMRSLISSSSEKQTELEDTKVKCIKAIDKQKDSINTLNINIGHNKNVTSRIDQLTVWNKQITLDIEALEADRGEFEELLSDTTVRANTLTTTLDTLNTKLAVLDAVKHIVSEEGVKSFIIKKLLMILNGKLAYYLNKLDAPCRFKFNEYFGEQIINDKGQECSYNNFSSGEKKRIDLAILFTFMDIRRLQGNTSLNIAFYDEILDTSLDDKGIEDFLEILNERVEKYDEACYIISHKFTAIKAATNDVIFLEKANGFTTIGDITEE